MLCDLEHRRKDGDNHQTASHFSNMDTLVQDRWLVRGCEHVAWMAIVGTAEHGFPVKGEVSHSAEDNCHARKRYMSWLYNGNINAAAMPPGLPTLLFCFLGPVVVVGLSCMLSIVLLLGCTPRQSRGGAVCRTCLRRSDAFQAAVSSAAAQQQQQLSQGTLRRRMVMRFFFCAAIWRRLRWPRCGK